MMKSFRPVFSVVSLCAGLMVAGPGPSWAQETGTALVKTLPEGSKMGTMVPESGLSAGKTVHFSFPLSNPELSAKIKPGVKVQYFALYGGYAPTFQIRAVIGTPPAASAAKQALAPAPAKALSVPAKATVKTYDAARRRGTLTPAGGGADLEFMVAPEVTKEPEAGSKVVFQAVVTEVEP